jgi:hypothetical protein
MVIQRSEIFWLVSQILQVGFIGRWKVIGIVGGYNILIQTRLAKTDDNLPEVTPEDKSSQ